jgi:uncharacterized protein YndB with AHSA1/START domain
MGHSPYEREGAIVKGMKTSRRLSLLSFTSLLTAACGPSLATMHEGAMAGRVQEGAPLHARQTVTIAAPRERVYALLTDFGGWPRWQPNIAKVDPPAAVEPGARFTWVNGGSEISSQLAAVKPHELLAWTGSVSTAKAVHVWHLSSPSPETTRVDVEETMDGLLLTWFYGQKDLEAEMARSLANLERAAESAR